MAMPDKLIVAGDLVWFKAAGRSRRRRARVHLVSECRRYAVIGLVGWLRDTDRACLVNELEPRRENDTSSS